MTRLERVLQLIDRYDALAEVALCLAKDFEDEIRDLDLLFTLRQEKEKLTQELIEHGCRRKN